MACAEVKMSLSIRQEAEQLLDQLPPEGLVELKGFIELLALKYKLKSPITPKNPTSSQTDIPAQSLTARFQGLVQSPLKVAELSQAYELELMGDDEQAD
jgi:hypothetical protein